MKLCAEVSKMLLTMTEAATLCNCSYSTIQKLVRVRKLPVIKRGKTYLISVDTLSNYIDSLFAK